MSSRAVACVVALAAIPVVAGGADAAAAPYDFAVGSGKNRLAELGGPVQLEVSAHVGADGEPTGHVRSYGNLFAPLPGGDFQAEGEVTCLRVVAKPDRSGWYASIKYRFKNTSGSLAPPEGGGVEVYIEDNGPPVGGQPVDANATSAPQPAELFDPAADQCSDPALAGQPFNPVDQGDYTVRSAG
jgi:hypothetical protein